ncbi:MAG: AI-2E family transporter [Ginsengibacter sp.]
MNPIRSNSGENNLNFSKKVWIAGGIISLIIISLLLFKILFSVILLTIAAILIAIYFLGCADFFEGKLNISRGLAMALSIGINIILITAFFWFVGARLQNQVSQLSDSLPQTIENAKTHLQQSKLGSKALNYLNFSGDSQKTFSVARKFLSSGFGIISDIYIVLLLAIFFITGHETYKTGIIKLLPQTARKKGKSLLDELYQVLKKWIKGQLFGFLFIAVLSGLGLWALRMPLILTLALIAGIMNFIPNFGPIIALIPAVLLGLMQGTNTAIWIVGLYTFIQIIQSTVTQPLIQKKMVNLPPGLVIFGQVAMGLLGGFWGVLLASPIVAIIMTTVNKLYVEKLNDEQE